MEPTMGPEGDMDMDMDMESEFVQRLDASKGDKVGHIQHFSSKAL